MSAPGHLGTLIVTGASRGIGAEILRLAARRGWSVVGTYRERREAAESVAAGIVSAGGKAIVLQGDTSVEADVVKIFETAEQGFGQITGLVNNAAINGKVTTVADLATDELRRLLDVNVVGCFLCAREAVRRMATDRGGRGGAIVNIGSVAAVRGNAFERVHYAASKAALITMTTGLAQEVAGIGIRVNAVSPGVTETDMNSPERLARVVPTVPMRRVGRPAEIAEVVMFALSPAASYVTGTNITVSGGR